MGTKRERKTHPTRQRITAEAVALFREATQRQSQYLRCVRGQIPACPQRVHCTNCARYLELSRALDVELHIPPWDPDPLMDDCVLRDDLKHANET